MAEDRSERKLATVLFADLAGSMSLAGEQDPERTRARLERFYDAMAAQIQAAGGTVEKFAGDAVMAAFGAPEALEDMPSAHCTPRSRCSASSRKVSRSASGVNTGEVVAGVARAGSSFVSGDAVNVAARLEQAAEPGETLAGERTGWGRTRGVRVRRAVYRGGEGEAGRRSVPTRRPRALADASARVSGLARAFVERDDEVRRLCEAYHAAVKTSRAPVTRRTVPA